MEAHYIVCGYGNIGRAVVQALIDDGARVVVIDRTAEKVEEAERVAHALRGEAHDNELLLAAGVDRARGLIAAVGSDAENLYIGLAARRYKAENPRLFLVARASTDKAKESMDKAEVFDLVTTPYTSAGQRLAGQLRERGVDLATERV